MAGDRYTTETETMESTATRIDDAAANFSSEVQALMSRLSGMANDYVGGGGTAFQNVSSSVSGLTAVAYQALAETAELVRTAGRSYAITDEELRTDMESAGAEESAIAQALLINPGGGTAVAR
jgi:WXG100 family type VII secretion target